MIDYVVRKEFDCVLEGDVFYSPFEIFNLYLSITVQNIVLDPKLNSGKNIKIKFNCMNSKWVQTIDADPKIEYGCYTLARHFLDSDTSKYPHHRFLPISVTNTDKRIGSGEQKTVFEEAVDVFKSFEDY
jgi:hypothetical protein